MNTIKNNNHLWYFDICDKTTSFTSKMRKNNSKTHIHKKEYGSFVNENEFNNPDIDEVNCLLNDIIQPCIKKCFHSFDYRCIYDIKTIIMENNEEVIPTITLGYMKDKSQFYGLSKKIKNERKNCFRFSEIVKLIQVYQMLNVNICYYLKFPIPIMHRGIFE